MNTILLLARRDLRLHPSALLLPGLMALLMALLLAFLIPPNAQSVEMLTTVLSRIAFGFGTLVPLILFLRESGAGTLADQRALPVSARTFARLRLFQALLIGGSAWALVLLCGLKHVGLQTLLPRLGLPLLGWILLWTYAFPMALLARWGVKSFRFYGPCVFLFEFWGFRHIPLAELKPSDDAMATLVRASKALFGPVDAFYALSPWLEPLMVLMVLALAQTLVRLALERSDA